MCHTQVFLTEYSNWGLWLGIPTGDSDWGRRLRTLIRTRPEELKFQLWSRLSEKCPKILWRTVVCACGLRLRTPLRTRPEELKFQLWSSLSEKCQKKWRRTVVCGYGLWCGVVWFYRLNIIPTVVSTSTSTQLRTIHDELKFQPCSRLSVKFHTKKLRRTVVCGCGIRLRTRPDELKFQLWWRLSEKFQKNLRRTVVCGFFTPTEDSTEDSTED